MRIAILSTILATAATLAACSGGGPGSLEISALDLGREPVTDGTFGAPYEPPPNRAGSIPTTQEDPKNPKTPNPNQTDPPSGFDSGTPTEFDAGTRRDSSTSFDSGGGLDTGTPDTGVTGTCTDLEACCPSLPSSAQSGCTSAVTNGDDTVCGSNLAAYQQAGYCI